MSLQSDYTWSEKKTFQRKSSLIEAAQKTEYFSLYKCTKVNIYCDISKNKTNMMLIVQIM